MEDITMMDKEKEVEIEEEEKNKMENNEVIDKKDELEEEEGLDLEELEKELNDMEEFNDEEWEDITDEDKDLEEALEDSDSEEMDEDWWDDNEDDQVATEPEFYYNENEVTLEELLNENEKTPALTEKLRNLVAYMVATGTTVDYFNINIITNQTGYEDGNTFEILEEILFQSSEGRKLKILVDENGGKWIYFKDTLKDEDYDETKIYYFLIKLGEIDFLSEGIDIYDEDEEIYKEAIEKIKNGETEEVLLEDPFWFFVKEFNY